MAEKEKEQDADGNGHRGSLFSVDSPFRFLEPRHSEPPGGFPRNHKKVFVDAKAMKEQLKQNIHKPRYDVTDFYWDTGICQMVTRSTIFDNLTLSVIAFNALWISIDADLNDSEVLVQAHPAFIIAENLFCSYFFMEICVRFGSFKYKRNCFRDAWFCFDTFMVTLMVFETWVMSIIVLAMGGGQGVNLGSAAMVKMLRLLRLSRMARMARLLRSMPEILILIKGMVAAIRSVFFTLVLLVILLYIFAVLFRQLADGTKTGEEYFATVPRSMNKLLVYGIFYDNFGEIVDSIVEEAQAVVLLFFFYSFVLLASLTVMNMLIGVLCEVVSAVAEAEQEELTMTYLKDSLWSFVKNKEKFHKDKEKDKGKDDHNDDEGGGNGGDDFTSVIITKSDFREILEDPEAVRLLKDVEVDIFALVDLVDTLFSGDHGEEKSLTFPEFVQVMLEHRSNCEATVKDITDLRRYIRARVDRMDSDMTDKMKSMEAHVQAMSTMIEKIAGVENGAIHDEAKDDLKRTDSQATTSGKVAKWQARKLKLKDKMDSSGNLQQDGTTSPGPLQRTWTKMADTPSSGKVAGKAEKKDPGSSNETNSGRESKVSDSKKSKISDTE